MGAKKSKEKEAEISGEMAATKVKTTPFEGQKPGTSGLRKKTTVFTQEHYVENFVQATFNAVGADKLKGCSLIVGGDGRYYNKAMIQKIASMACANGVAKVTIGKEGLISTPAVSALIRRHDGGAPLGGFILTASHNPGGPENDCGIKYNIENGGPAPESITSKIFENTKTISEYLVSADFPEIDLSQVGVTQHAGFTIEIIDTTVPYVELMKEVFDFSLLKSLLERDNFSFIYDGMHGVAGPYAKAIFNKELGVPESNLLNCVPLEDFGGGHPDPNLTYAHELVEKMGLTSKGAVLEGATNVPSMGAAADGDADRNMILGRKFFVTPSDSVAVIAANAESCIPFFKNGLKAIARSMPTSAAADLVSKQMGTSIFQVPTGWKFFGNLMDSSVLGGEEYNPLICGEESFGTGSNHIREKDGIWAVLCWLSIVAYRNEDKGSGDALVSIEDIVKEHWAKFGRNYYSRYDYENVESEKAAAMMAHLTSMIASLKKGEAEKELMPGYVLGDCDEFEYHDPVDKSVSSNQGWRFNFTDGSRFVFRLSGTGSVGATIRLYLEKFESDADKVDQATSDALADLSKIALDFSKIEEFTGRDKPTVIT